MSNSESERYRAGCYRVVRSLFVLGWSIRVLVHLNQHKLGGIVEVLFQDTQQDYCQPCLSGFSVFSHDTEPAGTEEGDRRKEGTGRNLHAVEAGNAFLLDRVLGILEGSSLECVLSARLAAYIDEHSRAVWNILRVRIDGSQQLE